MIETDTSLSVSKPKEIIKEIVEEFTKAQGETDEPEQEVASKIKEDDFKIWSRKEPMDKKVEPVKRPVLGPNPQRQRKTPIETKSLEFMELFKQVKINILLLDAIN